LYCKEFFVFAIVHVYTNIDLTLVNSLHSLPDTHEFITRPTRHSWIHYTAYQSLLSSLHGLLNCEIGGLDRHVITTEYRTCVHCIHM